MERYNEEVDNTIALTNMAIDYDIACKIRAFANELEKNCNQNDHDTIDYVQWAKDKADWFDPSIAKVDDYFGKRKHEERADYKVLRYANHWNSMFRE